MLRVAGLLSVAYLAFFLYCVLDVLRTPPADTRTLPKPAWLLVVLFVPLVGCLAWAVGGRPEPLISLPDATGVSHRVSRDHPSVRHRPAPPKGPDDDPAFLRRLDEQLRRSRQDDEGDAGGG